MLLPERLPVITPATFEAWRGLTYPQLATAVLAQFIDADEIPRVDLEVIIASSFLRFGDARITPIVSIGDIAVCELWHGPTLAFKDLGLQVLYPCYAIHLS